MAPNVLPDETSKETQEEFYRERNSLRRFLVGIIATTFGVLVALHPNVYTSIMGRWCYVISVIANALSLLFFIGSLYGRYFMLIEKWKNIDTQFESAMHGIEYKPVKLKFAKIFSISAILGLFFYLLAVVAACIFIVLEVL